MKNQEYVVINEDELKNFTHIEIPLEFGGYNDRFPIITVTIQNKDFKLMLDTGSGKGTINLTPKSLNRINVSFTGNQKTYEDLDGNQHHVHEYCISSTLIGSLNLSNIVGTENLASPEDFDGLVGLGLLKNFNM